jgi:acyl-CoA dehydrogenase
MPLEFTRSWSGEEVEAFRNSWVRFVETEMAPQDEEARKRGHVAHELWRRAGELGFLCVDILEEWGGAGGDFRHEAVLHEEMARRALSGMSIGVHSIAAHYLLNHGTDDQKRRYLPRLAKGNLVGAIAMSEPGAGSDLQAIRTRAEKHGNQYAITGSKTFISNGFLAGLVVVVCKTDPSERARGISLMLVETQDCPGFRVGRLLDKIGRKAQDTAELFFDEVKVPAENLLGGVEGKGFYQLMDDLPYERMLIGVGALAAMEGD